MVNCNACDGESFNQKDRMKGSTCEDCFIDNSIGVSSYGKDPCDCHAVGHDKSKLNKMEPLSDDFLKEREKQIKQMESENPITILQERKDKEDNEMKDYIKQRIQELRRDKDISEDDESV